MRKIPFVGERVYSFKKLESKLIEAVESNRNYYFIVVNDWDKLSLSLLKEIDNLSGRVPLYVISIFDIPNVIQIFRGFLEENNNLYDNIKLDSKLPLFITVNEKEVYSSDYPGIYFSEILN